MTRVEEIIVAHDDLKQRYIGRDGAVVFNTFHGLCDVLIAVERRGGDPLEAAIQGLAELDARLARYLQTELDRLMNSVEPRVLPL